MPPIGPTIDVSGQLAAVRPADWQSDWHLRIPTDRPTDRIVFPRRQPAVSSGRTDRRLHHLIRILIVGYYWPLRRTTDRPTATDRPIKTCQSLSQSVKPPDVLIKTRIGTAFARLAQPMSDLYIKRKWVFDLRSCGGGEPEKKSARREERESASCQHRQCS